MAHITGTSRCIQLFTVGNGCVPLTPTAPHISQVVNVIERVEQIVRRQRWRTMATTQSEVVAINRQDVK